MGTNQGITEVSLPGDCEAGSKYHEQPKRDERDNSKPYITSQSLLVIHL